MGAGLPQGCSELCVLCSGCAHHTTVCTFLNYGHVGVRVSRDPAFEDTQCHLSRTKSSARFIEADDKHMLKDSLVPIPSIRLAKRGQDAEVELLL